MDGFTQIKLHDCSRANIDRQNARLEILKVPKKYRFSSEADTIAQYEWFIQGKGTFPEHMFPKDKINSYEDFKRYWNPKALGECFVPPDGTLQFDCYFGRTPESVMSKIGVYVAKNITEFKSFHGSFNTFMERGMTMEEREIVKKSGILKGRYD